MLWVKSYNGQRIINLENILQIYNCDGDICAETDNYANFKIGKYYDTESGEIALDILARRMAKANTLFVQMPTQAEVDAQIARQSHD